MTRPVAIECLPPDAARPWAGTVSHHLLAYAQIDRWFKELAWRRSVRVFYVLTPAHYGISTQEYSVTDGAWRVKGGLVKSDRARARLLARALGVPLEPSVFDPEHGASTLMPYIARYFPEARVVAVAYRGEPPVDQPMAERLFRALEPAFSAKGRRDNFLLISTDFSHHGNEAATLAKDARTAFFFAEPSVSNWILAGCDNRPGIYALSRLLDRSSRTSVLFHCDSYALTGLDDGDVTSYFFSYFW